MDNRENTLRTTGLRATMLLLLMAVAHCTYAQYNSMAHFWPDLDAKNYTTRAIPSSNLTRESVMAGTIFDNGTGFGVPHFLKCDDGLPTNAYPGITAETTYPHTHFIDQRVVDVVSVQHDEHYIVALARRDPSNPMAAPFNDVIRVIKVDDAGNNTAAGYGDLVIDDLNFSQGNLNIYPMAAMYRTTVDPNTTQTHKVLYICGFVSRDNTQYPNYPDMNSEKRAFILALNIGDPADLPNSTSPLMWTLINANYFESSPCSTPLTPGCTINSPELDWDIAMHMQTLQVSANNIGDIFMTGSVNAKTGQHNGYPYPYTFVRSASMVHVLDPWTLVEVSNNVNPQHVVELGNQDGYGRMEYGVALIEAPSGDDNYLVSNLYGLGFATYPSGNGTPPNDWVNTYSFNEAASLIAITHFDKDFGSTYLGVSQDRLILDQNAAPNTATGLIALDVLPSQEIPTNALGAAGTEIKFIIAGMAYDGPQSNNCVNVIPGAQLGISTANMLPFLYQVDIDWTKRPGAFPNSLGTINYYNYNLGGPPYGSYIRLYPTQRGTGDPAGFTNTYANLGGGLSHIAWAPDFADINSNDVNSIIMNAPWWAEYDPGNGTVLQRLGLKTMFVDATNGNFLSMTSPCAAMFCEPIAIHDEVELIDDADEPHDIVINVNTEQDDAISATLLGDCEGRTSTDPVYKPAGIEQLSSAAAKIYPNPANDNIHVQLSQEVNGKVNVRMVNIYGQIVGDLFSGHADELRQKNALSLPAVASGLYMVQVFANGQMVHQERLSVHQR